VAKRSVPFTVVVVVTLVAVSGCTAPNNAFVGDHPTAAPRSVPQRCPATMPRPSKSLSVHGSNRTMVPGAPSTLVICRYAGAASNRPPTRAAAGTTYTSGIATSLNRLRTVPTAVAESMSCPMQLHGPLFGLFFNYANASVQYVEVPGPCRLVWNGRRFAALGPRLIPLLGRFVG
jgi:hypothetical protein